MWAAIVSSSAQCIKREKKIQFKKVMKTLKMQFMYIYFLK